MTRTQYARRKKILDSFVAKNPALVSASGVGALWELPQPWPAGHRVIAMCDCKPLSVLLRRDRQATTDSVTVQKEDFRVFACMFRKQSVNGLIPGYCLLVNEDEDVRERTLLDLCEAA